MNALKTLAELEATIADRLGKDADTSYTASLLKAGTNRCAKKFGEEATELIIACLSEEDSKVTGEAADVLYHFLVLLRSRDVSLTDVLNELQSRTKQSGLEEKASRQTSG